MKTYIFILIGIFFCLTPQQSWAKKVRVDAKKNTASKETLTPPTTPLLALSDVKFMPGASIVVKFKAPAGLPNDAWIGIIPSHIPHGSEFQNDQYDITYQYLNGQIEGTLTFNGPTQGGNYDFRMNSTDQNGTELASASFTIEGTLNPETVKATLDLNKLVFNEGEEISVRFSAPASFALDAWMGVIPSSVSHGNAERNERNNLSYQYLNGRTRGTLIFVVNSKGSYDLRLHDKDKNGVEVASVSFQVVAKQTNP